MIKDSTLAKKIDKGAPLPWELAKDFVLAGRCVLTLEDVASGHRNTYLVSQAYDEVQATDDEGNLLETPSGQPKMTKVYKDLFFVKLLVGSDNNRSFAYLGVVDQKYGDWAFRTTTGTKTKAASAENINRFGDTLRWLVAGQDASHKVRVWHRGMCGHCGKDLTVPSSIATGIGPICAKKLGIEMKNVDPSVIEKLAAMAPVEGDAAQDNA